MGREADAGTRLEKVLVSASPPLHFGHVHILQSSLSALNSGNLCTFSLLVITALKQHTLACWSENLLGGGDGGMV